MTSELETIARAIHAKSQAPDAPDMWRWITSWCPSGDWTDIGDGPRDAFIAMARASVESMREPTLPMKGAGWRATLSPNGISSADLERAWTAMIDIILNPQQEKS